MTEVLVPTAAAMRALGTRVADEVSGGDLVVLAGDLGAGKTTFVQGLAAGLGVGVPVLSPTFVIARVYRDARIPLVHVDAYRLGSIAEVDDLDLDASLEESVTVVEWGSGLVESLNEDRLELHLARSADGADETRTVTVVAAGSRWDAESVSRAVGPLRPCHRSTRE